MLVVTMFFSMGRIVSWITAGFTVRWIVVSCLSDSEVRSEGSTGTIGPFDTCLLWPLSVLVPVLLPVTALFPEAAVLEPVYPEFPVLDVLYPALPVLDELYPELPVLEMLYPEVLWERFGPSVPDRCCKSRLTPVDCPVEP